MLVYFIVLTNIILPYCILFYYAEIFSALKASVSSLTNTEPVELGAPQVQVTKDSQKQNKLKASAQLGLIGLDAVLVLQNLRVVRDIRDRSDITASPAAVEMLRSCSVVAEAFPSQKSAGGFLTLDLCQQPTTRRGFD